jgi:putative hydrolase of the HAD superfamily
MVNKTFIFDMDDTLVHTHYLFSRAKSDFVKFVADTLGPRAPDIMDILKMHEKMDVELTNTLGFKIERFPTSLSRTYLDISQKLNESDSDRDNHASQAYKIGEDVFDEKFWHKDLVSNAIMALNFLLTQGDELFLITTGDYKIQQKKIEHYNLSFWFRNNIDIVSCGKKEKIDAICSSRDKRNTWFVGNSVKSDIVPSLEAGIGAIYIPFETWAYENHTLDNVDKSRLIKLDEIGLIPEIYFNL